jgi:hypothetical protein
MLHERRAMLAPMRTLVSIPALMILGALAGAPVAAAAEPAPQDAAAPVDDAVWTALHGRQVVIDTPSGAVAGELLRSDGTTLVLVQPDGRVLAVHKADATGVRVVQPASAETTTPVAPAPAEPTQPVATAPAEPAKPVATAPAEPAKPVATVPAEPEPAPAPAPTDPAATSTDEALTPAQQRRKERQENREHAILGAFTMHGATYTHWRDAGRNAAVNSGHASYAMDFGVGANLSPGFGVYAMAGGLLGAKIDDRQTNANYGHVAAMVALGGKHYHTMFGAGVAFNRLRFPDDRLEKHSGLALPFKLVGKLPLPKKLYIGLGLSYELGIVMGFRRFVNGIGGQIVVGRW